MASGIQVGDRTFALSHPDTGHPIPVFAWNDPPGRIRVPEFRAGDGYNKKRMHGIELVVWHWTGGEAEPDRMAETLRKRKLGVEFAIGRYGNVFQFCDPSVVDTADAGVVNHRSVGVEVVCYGFAGGWTFDPVRAVKVPKIPKLGRDREVYVAETHGRKVKTAKFYEAQVSSAVALAEALCAALDIPRRVPPPEADGVYDPALARDDQRFRGHVGHYHVSKNKRDPGPWFMDSLFDHFAGLHA